MAVGGAQHGRARVLISGSSWQLSAQVLPLVVNIVLTPFIIHGLGAPRYGLLLIVITISALIMNFQFGVGEAALRYFTIQIGAGDRRSMTQLLVSVTLVMLATASFLLAFAFPLIGRLLDFFRISESLRAEGLFLVRVSAALAGLLYVRQPLSALLYAHHRYGVSNTAVLVGHLIYAGGAVTTIVRGWGLYGFAGTFIVQQLVSTAIIVPRGLRCLSKNDLGWLPKADLLSFLGYAWKVQLAGIMTLIIAQKDQVVAGRVLGAESSAPFGQGIQFSQQIRMIPMNAVAPIQSLLGRAVGRLGARAACPEFEKLQRLWVIGVTGGCAVAIPATFFGVNTWVPQLQIAGEIAAILVAGQLGTLLPVVLVLWALALGHPQLDVRNGLTAVSINVALTLALLPALGPIGAVVATSLANIAACVLVDRWWARRMLPFPVRSCFRDVPVLQALFAGAGTWLLEYLLNPGLPRGSVGLVLCAALALPGLCVYVLTAVGPATVRQAVRRLASR